MSAAIFYIAASLPCRADDLDATNAPSALANLSIEDLMRLKVSILGPSQAVSKTPAAVSVITQSDIERSGAQNIPEALRLTPGLDVAQVDASEWAVSARGFNDVFANKLLVMQDGRSIYTPLFSGVFWDVQGTLMSDIDHIEVVRGPGATLWGANAVNGVINILTKSAEDTQGLLVTGGGGNQERGLAGVRYGGRINDNASYRIYGTYENHDSTEYPNGSDANNSWQIGRAGFRTDWNPSPDNLITIQGDGYAGRINQTFAVYDPSAPPVYTALVNDDFQVGGANVLGRWTHTISDTSELEIQTYYDFTRRNIVVFDEDRHTVDLSLKHSFNIGDRNKIVWGGGYRVTADEEKNNSAVAFNPESETLNVFSAFAQDEIELLPSLLSLTVGSKIEHNDYTGLEVQPGARLLFTPVPAHTFWASVSRAVRTPSRAEESVTLTEPGPGPVMVYGTNNFRSEELIAYELGYRADLFQAVSFDVAAFYNDYDELRSQDFVSATQAVLKNNLYGSTYGFEVAATWRALSWWQIRPAYTLLKMDLHAKSGAGDPYSVPFIEGSSPQNQFSIGSMMDLPHDVTFDMMLRYVDNLPAIPVESYFELDSRLGWRINKNWELAIVGQNLLHDRHAEFGPTFIKTAGGNVTEIPRCVYATVSWHF